MDPNNIPGAEAASDDDMDIAASAADGSGGYPPAIPLDQAGEALPDNGEEQDWLGADN